MNQGTLFDRLNPEPDRGSLASPSGVRWSADVSRPVAPSRSLAARHASATGAQVAAAFAGELAVHYLDLLERVGKATDHQAARALGCGLSSINSTRKAVRRWVVGTGTFDYVPWPSGRTSAREYYRLRTPEEIAAFDQEQAELAAQPQALREVN